MSDDQGLQALNVLLKNSKEIYLLSWWQKIIWRVFGVKRIAKIPPYKITAFYFRGVYVVTEMESMDE